MRRRSEQIAALVAGGAYLIYLTAGAANLWQQQGASVVLPDSLTIYPDVNSCAEALRDRQGCATAYKQAVFTHYRDARTFRTQGDCEESFGRQNCDLIADQGSGHYVPAFAGFVPGRALGTDLAVPVHYDRNGYARVVGGYTLGKKTEEEEQSEESSYSSSGHGSSWQRRSGDKPTTISTADSNMRGSRILRGGFGRSFTPSAGG